MAKAMEEFQKNPDMANQAAEMMKNMSPEDIARMTGTDVDTAKMRQEAMKNPDMIKSAMQSFQSMPEDDRKKMFEMAGQNGAIPGGQGRDMAQAMKMMENPQMMEQAMKMMEKMSPEDMEKMQKMAGEGGMGGDPASAMDAMTNNPEMLSQAAKMFENMSPEDIEKIMPGTDPGQAKMLGKMMPYMPYILRCMKVFGYARRGWKAIFTTKGRVVIALVILTAAVVQHYRSSA